MKARVEYGREEDDIDVNRSERRQHQKCIHDSLDTGAANSPTNTFNILMGLETLGLRMERHCENAEKLDTYLSNHPKVS